MKPQVDLFSFVVWRKLKTPKRHFKLTDLYFSIPVWLIACLLVLFLVFFFSSEIFQPWAKKCARSYLCHRLSLMAFYCCECKYNSNAWVKKKTGVRKTRTIISTIKGQLCSQASKMQFSGTYVSLKNVHTCPILT